MTKKKPFNEERWRRQVLRGSEELITQSKTKRSLRGRGLEARNLLHLLDLKRAGHSPTQTELNVPREAFQ